MQRLTLTRPDDWHLHLRDDAALRAVLPDTVRRFARAIVMPNLDPPVRTSGEARAYRERILAALPAGQSFEPLPMPAWTSSTVRRCSLSAISRRSRACFPTFAWCSSTS